MLGGGYDGGSPGGGPPYIEEEEEEDGGYEGGREADTYGLEEGGAAPYSTGPAEPAFVS